MQEKNAEDLGSAITIGFTYAFADDQTSVLCQLITAEWHFSHEDVVSALQDLRAGDPEVVEALFQATQWVPPYLDFDESRALASKAIWVLGKMPGIESENALLRLTKSSDALLRNGAHYQLQRRRS